jgi:TolB-like protein/Tfp pilus assembly protein PilF
MSFVGELKRRNVFRVAGVYAVVGWLLVQIAATVEEAIALPAWFDAVVLSFLVIVFPIALVFAWAFELTPEGIKRTVAVDADESITAQTASKLDMVLVVALVLFAGAMLAPRFLPQLTPPVAESEQADSEAAVVAAAADAVEVQTEKPAQTVEIADAPIDASIAVLPFVDLSQRGDQEYFADGISEELLNVLAKVRELKVAGRTSSFAFKGRDENISEIGRVLNVAHVLEGSVRSQGDRVRVTAQLIQVSDGYHLWSETYDGNLSDIFAVQDDIAQQILTALKEQLVVQEAPQLAQATRTDVTAYGLFLEARDLIYTRDEAKMTRAKALLDQVISIDPEYAPSYALRAKAYALLSDSPSSYGKIPLQEAYAKAQNDVDMALELDPELADAHAVRGLLANDSGNPDFAMASLRRALDINPNLLDARNWLALSLSDNGQIRKALEALTVLLEIDPLYPPAVNNAVLYASDLGDYPQAIAISERYIGLTDDTSVALRFRGSVLRLKGELAEALKLWSQILVVDRGRAIVDYMVISYLALGEDPQKYGVELNNPGFRATTRIRLGQHDKGLDMIEQAIAEAPEQVSVQLRFIEALSRTGQHERLLAYFEEQFEGDLTVYATRLRASALTEPPPFMQLALAAEALNKPLIYGGAMERWRDVIQVYRDGGANSGGADLEEARYLVMAGEPDQSMELLERAFEKDKIFAADELADPIYSALRDAPRFISLRNANAALVNAQRELMGWQPLPERVFIEGLGARAD